MLDVAPRNAALKQANRTNKKPADFSAGFLSLV
jgi:hypothetical protein